MASWVIVLLRSQADRVNQWQVRSKSDGQGVRQGRRVKRRNVRWKQGRDSMQKRAKRRGRRRAADGRGWPWAQTGRPPPAGATLLMTALNAGKSRTRFKKGMRLREEAGGQAGGRRPGHSSGGRSSRITAAGTHRRKPAGSPQEGKHGGEESAEEQPEAPHLQRKPCRRKKAVAGRRVMCCDCGLVRLAAGGTGASQNTATAWCRTAAALPQQHQCSTRGVGSRGGSAAHLSRSSPPPPAPRPPGRKRCPCSSWAAQRSAAQPAALSSGPRL